MPSSLVHLQRQPRCYRHTERQCFRCRCGRWGGRYGGRCDERLAAPAMDGYPARRPGRRDHASQKHAQSTAAIHLGHRALPIGTPPSADSEVVPSRLKSPPCLAHQRPHGLRTRQMAGPDIRRLPLFDDGTQRHCTTPQNGLAWCRLRSRTQCARQVDADANAKSICNHREFLQFSYTGSTVMHRDRLLIVDFRQMRKLRCRACIEL